MKKDTKFIYRLNGGLYVNLTNRCCNDCVFCLRRNGDGIKGDTLWLEREPSASEVVDAIKAAGFQYGEVVFCGYGESTYRVPEIVEISRYVRPLGKTTRLNTNGLGNLINGRDIVPDLKGNVDAVSVSLNESDAARYAALCRPAYGLDAYPAILDFCRRCVCAGINTVMTVVDVIPPAEIEKCRESARLVGARLRVRRRINNNNDYT
ncbi:MAG: TatD family nuclease-associated radical SAM protein [Clostridiales bacterium]|jgi:TatD family-associated radical SAM protein|nr:TatD family nuclease-associated radical SAM protein [Clostridiales bacterium]